MLKQYMKMAIFFAVTIGVSFANAGAYDDFVVAVERDDASTVSSLIKRGLDPNTRGPGGQPALTMALQKGSPKVVDALMQAPGTDLDLANEHGETPLMLASLKGAVDIARQLIERGAKLKRRNEKGLGCADFARLAGREALTARLEALQK